LAAGGSLGKGNAAAGVFIEKHFQRGRRGAVRDMRGRVEFGGALDGFGLRLAGESLLGGGYAAVAEDDLWEE